MVLLRLISLPYFRKQESWEDGASEYRGGDGPLATRRSRYADPLFEAWLEAGVAAGHPITEDYNGAEQHGFARMQCTIQQGRRCSAAAGGGLSDCARPCRYPGTARSKRHRVQPHGTGGQRQAHRPDAIRFP